jgi:dCTP deaminase
MAFWSTEKFEERQNANPVIDSDLYSAERIKCGGYELSLGAEYFDTSDPTGIKQKLDDGQQITILPGQFGLLLTEERVFVPADAIGFISIKASIKFRGLVNVSGFHVDSGFKGHLKFSVFNAGGQPVVLSRKQPVFIIWFSDLDRKTLKPYAGEHANQSEISSEDVMRIQGRLASVAVLDERLKKIEQTMEVLKGAAIAIGAGIFLLVVKLIWDARPLVPASSSSQSLNAQAAPTNLPSAEPTVSNTTTKWAP